MGTEAQADGCIYSKRPMSPRPSPQRDMISWVVHLPTGPFSAVASSVRHGLLHIMERA